jgi:uncharacterized protein DUF4440
MLQEGIARFRTDAPKHSGTYGLRVTEAMLHGTAVARGSPERAQIVAVKIRALLACLAAMVLKGPLVSVDGFAQPAAGTRIPTVTRLVKEFFELETTIEAKLAARDVAALDALLDANFEVRRAAAPGVPLTRDEWLRTAAGVSSPPKIDQIAVHDFGTVAVVSFRQVEAARKQPSRAAKERMIVDCWTRVGVRWVLVVRYEGAASQAAPSDGSDRRPSGRQ